MTTAQGEISYSREQYPNPSAPYRESASISGYESLDPHGYRTPSESGQESVSASANESIAYPNLAKPRKMPKKQRVLQQSVTASPTGPSFMGVTPGKFWFWTIIIGGGGALIVWFVMWYRRQTKNLRTDEWMGKDK